MAHSPGQSSSLPRSLAMIGLVNGVAGILLQYVLFQPLFRQLGMSWTSSAIAMLCYFTILTNLMVVAVYWAQLRGPNNRFTRFFARPGVRTAVTAYVVFVGLVYAGFLYGQLPLSPGQQVPDAMLHFISPPLCLAWWWSLQPAHHGWRHIARWIVWPVSYLAGLLAMGAITNAWIYPILDAAKLGWPQTLVNASGMIMLLAGLLSLLVGIARRRALSTHQVTTARQ